MKLVICLALGIIGYFLLSALTDNEINKNPKKMFIALCIGMVYSSMGFVGS